MVDFQSRETHRGSDDAESGSEDDTASSETAASSATDADSAAGAGVTPAADAGDAVSVAILVTGTDATEAADAVADAIATEHEVLGRDERTGDLDAIQTAVDTFLDQPTVEAVVTVGGVGVGPDEVAVEAVEPLLDTQLPGFGELFRRRHADEVGTKAIRNRAIAGLADTTPVFCLPGETASARAATTDLLVPELDGLISAAGTPQSAD